MSLNTNAIVTLAEAKTQLGMIATQDDAKDDYIETCINEISSYVEIYCKRKIVSQNISNELHDGDGSSFLYPRYFPIQQLSIVDSPTDAQKLASLQYRNTPDGDWVDVETDMDFIFIDTGDNALLTYIELYDELFPVGRRNIQVTYRAGYSTVPGDIKQVVLEMIQMRWRESAQGGNILGLQTISNGVGGQADNLTIKDINPKWMSILNRYRVPSI